MALSIGFALPKSGIVFADGDHGFTLDDSCVAASDSVADGLLVLMRMLVMALRWALLPRMAVLAIIRPCRRMLTGRQSVLVPGFGNIGIRRPCVRDWRIPR